ncbi:MAG: helix-turn-helix domain-containing protein [Planctomycetota bacterium]
MAGKLIELKEAAAQLGISPDKLQDMREAGEIHGYKDGTSWKFKPSEIERIAKERGVSKGGGEEAEASGSVSLSDDGFDELLDLDGASSSGGSGSPGDNSSVLIDEESSGDEQDFSSTVVGKEEKKQEEPPEAAPTKDSSGDSSGEASSGGESSKASDEEDYELKLADSEDDSDDLALPDDLDFESDAAMALDDDVDLELAVDSDDEESVEPDSGSSEGELAIDSSDSEKEGQKTPDSEPGSEEGSSVGLELPEDDDMISVEDQPEAASDDAAELQQDEEFLLSPSDSVLGDESSDSGSQVIALEDSSAFESDSDVEAEEGAEPMLVEDEGEALDDQLGPIDAAAAEPSAVPVSPAEAIEADYTIWNIVALLLVVLLLSTVGMLMADVVRNLWSWNSDMAASSAVADSIIETLGMN